MKKSQLSKQFVLPQVLQPLEGVGVVVFPEFRLALLPPRGAVAGGLGFHPVPRQPGTRPYRQTAMFYHVIHELVVLKRSPINDA